METIRKLLGLKSGERQRLEKKLHQLRAERVRGAEGLQDLKDEIRRLAERAKMQAKEHEESPSAIKRTVQSELEGTFKELDRCNERADALAAQVHTVALAVDKLRLVLENDNDAVSDTDLDELKLILDDKLDDFKIRDKAAADLEQTHYQPNRMSEEEVGSRFQEVSSTRKKASDKLPSDLQKRLKQLE